MPVLRIVALAFAVLISTAPGVFAQLGPKDTTEMPPTDINRVKVGQPAPDFSLEDVSGKALTLSEFRDKKTVVLVFYRGYW